MKKVLALFAICLLFTVHSARAAFTEPSMADYTAMPMGTTLSVPPNIMVILDNSGSMNFLAYGTWPGSFGATVTDEPFEGAPYNPLRSYAVISGQDDAQESKPAGSTTDYINSHLDLGGFSVAANDSVVAVRFQNVAIAQGATVSNAYIEFMSNAANAQTTNILIEGEASDNAAPFATTVDNIKGRTPTSAKVNWNSVVAWSANVTYPTADFAAIVQEIVNRPGWVSGNAMVFRFTGILGTNNKRDAKTYDTDAAAAPKLRVLLGTSSARRYFGYFSPDHFYTYGTDVFNLKYKKKSYSAASGGAWTVTTLDAAPTTKTLNDATIVSEKLWDGNWLNWLSMRRVDVLRKVLMGGLATVRDGTGNSVNIGETPTGAQVVQIYSKQFNSSIASAVSPYDGNYTYRVEGGYIYIGSGTTPKFVIKVQKSATHEPEDFKDGNLAGVLQRIGNKVRWGNMFFNPDITGAHSGGSVKNTIPATITNLINNIQTTRMETSTPLAETFYVAMQYFKQQAPATGLDYPTSPPPAPFALQTDDPYFNGTEYVPCAKSFVLLLTDGASTQDTKIPSEFKDYDGDGKDQINCTENYLDSTKDNCTYPRAGSDYLDDLAFYARTVDLRSATVGKSALDGDQNLILYAVHAFDKDPNATNLLKDAARNGGFNDRNGNKKPDLQIEWDKNSDGVPDTFFEASDGYELEARILAAITDMLDSTSSSTSASVLSTNNFGSGNTMQSYYRPTISEGIDEVRWLGYLQSLWVDPWGNLREDTNHDLNLTLRSAGAQNAADANVDRIVELRNEGNDTFVRRYNSHYLYNSDNGDTNECKVSDCDLTNKDCYEDVSLDSLQPLFEAGKQLTQRDPTLARKIFTYIGNGGVVGATDGVFDASGDVIEFNTANAASIKPFLGVSNDTKWVGLGQDFDTRVDNIISWIRGKEIKGLRNRTLEGVTWPLGDIINSTPIVIGSAKEYYHLLYNDKDYIDYINYAKQRETVTYVGANDGMMHAFTNYVFKKKADESIYYEKLDTTSEAVGDELWAYIPQAVLPHLKWTASVDYTHTYYVNSEPRVFDAKILPKDMYYTSSGTGPNYGTFMVFGLNMGGKSISVSEDFGSGTATVRNFAPTYVMMDITDPRNPRVMWERSYTGIGMSCSVPAPVRVGSLDGNDGKWFLVFGSGPTDYDNSSTQKGHIFVVDMLTGQPYGTSATEDWIWQSANNSYFNNPLALDAFTSNNTDVIYLAENYFDATLSKWLSNVKKVVVPCSKCAWDVDGNGVPLYSVDQYAYNNDPSKWGVNTLFSAPGPVSVKLNTAADPHGNVMLYFGTGRYLSTADRTDANQQYLYCVKDPFYNEYKYKGTSYLHSFGSTNSLLPEDLMNSNGIVVTTKGNVSGYSDSSKTNFWDFAEAVRRNEDGWQLALQTDGTNPAERIVSQTTLYGGLFITPTFTPETEICKKIGYTNFLAGYYETGTAFYYPAFTLLPAGGPETTVSIRSPRTYIGMPPAKAIVHQGKEKGITITVQLSTGEFAKFYLRPGINNENAIMESYDDPKQAPLKNPECGWENYDTPAMPTN